MENDPHTNIVMLEYGLKLIEIFHGKQNRNLMEYLFNLFDHRELANIHAALAKEATKQGKRMSQDAQGKLSRGLEQAHEQLSMGDLDDYARKLATDVFAVQRNLHSWLLKKITALIRMKLKNIKDGSPVMQKNQVNLQERVMQLSKIFGLNDKENDILTLFFLRATNSDVSNMFQSDELKMDVVKKSIRNYCRFFELLPHELRDILKQDAPLVRAGILERRGRDDDLDISPSIVSYLAGMSEASLTDKFFELNLIESQLSIPDFLVSPQNATVMTQLLQAKKAVNLLLYGSPGTGKTEFAKTLAQEIGAEVWFVKQADEDGEESLGHRKASLVAAQNMLIDRKCVLIVDECDPIINTMGGLFMCDQGSKKDEKSWINHYMEKSELKIIWISNRTNGVDESTRRRFSYAQEFRNPGVKQRLKAWDIQTGVHQAKFLDQSTIEHMARSYCVSPGTIDLALRDVLAAHPEGDPNTQRAMLSNILEQQQAFCVGKSSGLAPINARYSLEGLNMDSNPEKILGTMKRFLDPKGASPVGMQIRNLNMLLVGPPGTGKTEFVKYVAENVDRELVVRRTSDLVSKFVGESEKNIADAFSDAEKRGAILFLDEADSLFLNRESVRNSWEMSQTNELLCQMENFAGILMCATNYHQSLDVAVMRRFSHKIGFDYLLPEGNVAFFGKILSPLLKRELTVEEASRISAVRDIAPGDFKVVYQQYAFDEDPGFNVLYAALENEARYRSERGNKTIRALS